MLRQLIVFGAVVAAVVAVTAPVASSDPPPGRYQDVQPHFGGAAVTLHTDFCTSGFSVRKNGSRTTGSVVAGHCFPKPDDGVSSGDQFYGQVATVVYDHTHDMSLVTGAKETPQTYSPSIWVDPGLPAARRVIRARDPLPTDSLCVSGAKSANHCGLTFRPNEKVQSCSLPTDDPPNFCTTGLSLAINPSPDPVVRRGDSGAPLYVLDKDTGGVIIVGMLVGGDLNNPATVAFEPISFIQQSLGVTVLVTTP
jgi:hypothetical protein